MPNITPQHSPNSQSLTEQIATLTVRVDCDMAAVFERLDQQDQAIAALQAQIKPVTPIQEDRAAGRIGGYVLSLLAGLLALTLCWERRDDGFYPRQDVSPYLIPLVVLAGLGLGVPISSGVIGGAIDKIISKP